MLGRVKTFTSPTPRTRPVLSECVLGGGCRRDGWVGWVEGWRDGWKDKGGMDRDVGGMGGLQLLGRAFAGEAPSTSLSPWLWNKGPVAKKH